MASKKEKPRFKVISDFENEFKNDYYKQFAKANAEILKSLAKFVKTK